MSWERGYTTTAKMMWRYKSNPEAMALIWIAASIINLSNSSVITDDAAANNLTEIGIAVFSKRREMKLERWHGNTKYLLPNSIFDHYHFKNLLNPKSIENLLSIISLE